MDSIEFEIAYAADVATVTDAFWRVERWPELTEHVTGIEIHYEDECIQVLTMKVQTRGSHAAFRTMRCLQGNRIYYFQPAPPPFLLTHGGWWEVAQREQGCAVISRHQFLVEPERATAFATEVLDWDGLGPVAARIGELLRANSRQTMEALRRAMQGAAVAA